MRSTQRYLFLATVVLCIGQSIQENAEEIQESFHFRRAIDGSRGRKYFNPDEDGSYDSYDSTNGDYDSSQVESGFSDIRSNVPGEPGVNYPTYTSVPKTRFSCHGRMSGYYADEEAGCQVFHVCHNVVVSSFLCPVGSIFSQTLLTCDWWNNVECEGPNDDFFPHQEIPQNEEQMIQKAYEMMQLSKPNSGSSDQQVRGRQLNIAKVADRDNGKTNIREGIAVSGERNPQNYRHYHTEQPPLQENSRLRKNNDDVNDDHTPSKQNLINIRLRPKNFQINRPGEDSRLNDRAKDSSVIYIQKNVNDDSQNAYSTLRPFVIQENFRNSDDHDVNIYKEEFQPSYAPTVPTVTTTTRKLYSPTVPVTTYRPSTTSYKNDDQDLGSSDHLYIHGKNSNILTSQPTVIYEDLTPENNNFTNSVILNRKASEKSDTADKEHHENVAKSVKPTESFGSELQDTYLSNHKSNIGNTKEEVEIVPSIFNSESYSHGQNYQHFYADQDSLSEEFRARVTGKREGFLVDNYANAALQTGLVNDGKKEDSDIFNSPGKIPPLIVQLPRPLGSSDSSSIDIRDQLFTFNTFNMSLAPIPQPPQLGGSLGMNSKDTMSANVTSERPNMIPLLIPQNSPPMLPSGIRSPGAIYDENTSNEPRISIPSISEIGSSGTVIADVDSRIQTSASSTRIPPRISQTLEAPSRPLLISQISQSAGLPGAVLTDTADRPQTSQPSDTIPPLIPQSLDANSDRNVIDASTRIPPLITQTSQPAGLPGVDLSDVTDSTQNSQSPGRIPLVITPSMNSNNNENISGAPARIPPLIWQISQSAESVRIDSTDVMNRTQISQPSNSTTSPIPQSLDGNSDRNAFDASTRIPPLITQTVQPTGLPEGGLSDVTNRTQNSQLPTRIPLVIPQSTSFHNNENMPVAPARMPPLIWQISQSAESAGIDSTHVVHRTQVSQPSNSLTPPILQSSAANNDKNVFDTSTRIPPLITQSSGVVSADSADRTETSKPFNNVPSLIPQSLDANNDENIFDTATRVPSLITQTSGVVSTDSADRTETSEPFNNIPPLIPQSSDANNDENIFDTATKVPPLITQTSGVISTDSADRTETSEPFINIPPLIPQSSDANNDENIFDTATKVPPLITQTSGVISTDSADRTENSEPFNNIPPLIPQSSDANNDENIFDTATKVPPLITQTSGVISTDSADRTETSEPFINIPPLIPQSSDANNDENIFDTATKVPPLITQTSGVISTDSADRTENSEPFNNIPPLIPQSSDANNDENIFDTATRVPPLITQASGVISTDYADRTETSEPFNNIPPLIPQPSDANNDENIFDTATRVPPLITQASGVISTDYADRTETSEPFNNIPPLIPQSSDANNDENIFDTATRVPPLITQTSGVESTDSADTTETSEPFINIPPLIPQSSDANNDENIFDTATKVPPLITQTSGVISTDSADRTENSEPFNNIPPLIPQSSDANNDENIFDTATRVPPLITQASGVISTDYADRTETSEPFNNIPPLIPQPSDANNDENIFDTATRVPPLITVTPGVVSTDITHRTETETSEPFNNIPPLIPQSSDANNDENIFDTATKVPPLITQTSGVISTDSADRTETSEPFINIPPLIPQSSDANNDENIFDTATKVPPLITQTSGVVSTDSADRTETSKPFNNIPPLIPQSSDANNDENIFDTATRVPPLITETSGVVSTDSADRTETETSQSSNSIPPLIPQSSEANNDTNVFNTPTRIPSLIPGTVKSTPSFSAQNPSTVNNQNVPGKPPNIPPFISQIPQGGDSMVVIHQPQTLDVSTVISPPIPQTSKSTEMPVTQFPCVFTEINSVSCKNPPMLSKTPNSSNSSDGVLVGNTEKEHVASSSPYIPPLITDVLQPPKLPAIDLMDIFNRRPAILPSTEAPPLIQTSNAPDPWTVPLHDLSNPFHPSFSSAPGKLYLSPKEYQRPMSFNSIQIPQQQLGDQLAVQPPVKHLTYDSSVGNPETKNSQFAVVESTSKESSTTSYPNIASTLSPPRFDNPFVTPSEKSLEADTSDTRGPIAQGFIPAGYNENIRFHTGGASLYPQFYTIPSTLISQAVESSLDTQGEKTIGLQNSQSADDSTSLLSSEIVPHNEYRQNTMANVFSKATSAESNVRFESSTPKNVLDITGITTTGKFDASNKDSVQAVRPNISAAGLPVSLSQIEDSINNSNDLPYEIAFTINAGEDFNPSGDFISKLLAQHQNNGSPGFAGLEGYEIIRSDDIETSVNEQNLEPTVAPTIAPAIAPTITPTVAPTVQSNTAGGRLLFDPRISLEDNQSGKRIIFSNPLLSPATITRSKSVGNRAEEIDPVKSEVLPRPFPFGTEQSVALNARLNSKFDYLSILNQPSSTSNRDVNLLAKDINGSLESLFASAQKTAVTSIPSREQLLEELTKNFGQPYFSSDTHQSYFTPPTTSANINYKFPSPFVNLEQYRTGKKASGWQSAPTSSELPKTPTTTSTTTTTTTTTTTPKPIKTFVETEFIPSLSFSFDSDYERKAYVDAVLNGFVTENQFIDPWRDTASTYWEPSQT
ncbi:mucin-16-like isoform X2 [Neodiprion lecontei]|uniref:Mucin-16-like isoform X2 n=1 Tax=Neodiprion lecontei TaxID=441921 RepID=A0A6J0BQ94_NEOLC|nr:mucin-16-like isoform X2 [Neodiprion lecontei]